MSQPTADGQHGPNSAETPTRIASNTVIWDKLGRTDPANTKKFQRAGGFKGTAIRPIYTERKMTEVFGACGVGWGINKPDFQVVSGSDGQTAVYCTVAIWIMEPGAISEPIYGVGGDMVVVKQSSGLRTDDEAFKKAFTDAVGNAMKHLGMSADVHMGLFDDSKYVDEVREEFASTPVATVPVAPTRLPKAQARELFTRLNTALNSRASALAIETWWSLEAVQLAVATLPEDWASTLSDDVFKAYETAATGEKDSAPRDGDFKSPTDSLDELIKSTAASLSVPAEDKR